MAIFRQRNGLDQSVIPGIENVDFAGRFRRNVSFATVGQKNNAVRPGIDRDLANHFEVSGVDRENVPGSFASHIKEFAVGTDADGFGFAGDRDGRDDFFRTNVDHGNRARISIGDVKALAVKAEGELPRIGSRGNSAKQLIGAQIHHANTISRVAAQGHVESFVIGARLHTPRAAADRNGFEKLEIAAIDDRDVPGFFIGDENLIVGLGKAVAGQGACKEDASHHPHTQ